MKNIDIDYEYWTDQLSIFPGYVLSLIMVYAAYINKPRLNTEGQLVVIGFFGVGVTLGTHHFATEAYKWISKFRG